MSRRCVIGVDVGGTNVRACAYYEDGTPAGAKVSRLSEAQKGADVILDAIAKTVLEAKNSATEPIGGIGLAIPGHIDGRVVVWAPNFGEYEDGTFRYWKDVPVAEHLSSRVELPVFLGNDANLAAMGEYRFGVGRGIARCLVLLTLGTGVGGGVVLSPSAVEGAASGPLLLVGGNKGGAELGHTIVHHGGLDCNAGSYGSLEAYCGRDAIVSRAVHRLQRGRSSSLSVSDVTPKLLAEAAETGDELALEVWEEVGTWLGVGIGSLINVFAPDVFAIGGQISKAGELLLGPARKAARNIAVPSLFQDTKIVQAEQIDEAGMLGGAALALESLKWN